MVLLGVATFAQVPMALNASSQHRCKVNLIACDRREESSLIISSKAYKFLMGHHQIHSVYNWLWECLCQPKHKVFFWLLLKDKLSTRNILKRRNMQLESYNCVLCLQNTEETCQHLFLQCPFAVQFWQLISIDIPINDDFPEITDYLKDRLHSQFVMAAIILTCW
jgi:hypothetical protein